MGRRRDTTTIQLEDQLVAAVAGAGAPLTPRAAAERVGCTRRMAVTLMGRLARDGRLVRVGNGLMTMYDVDHRTILAEVGELETMYRR